MIGLAVHSTEQDIVAEFFELFKTPWEYYQKGRHYDVVICTQEEGGDADAKLVLLYSSGRLSFDAEKGSAVKNCQNGAVLSHDGQKIPLYGNAASFSANQFFALKEDVTNEPMAFLSNSGQRQILRIGYDLFQEVRLLLTVGQPPANAGKATLERHIALLRDFITRSGLPLIEIPPVPDGYGFMVCLTHDLDHPVLAPSSGLLSTSVAAGSLQEIFAGTGLRPPNCRSFIWEWQKTRGADLTAIWKLKQGSGRRIL